MLPAVSRGTERREYEPWEVQALADIGYEVFAPEPPPLPDDTDVIVDEEEDEEPDSVTGFSPSSGDSGNEPAGVVPADTGTGCAVQSNTGGRAVAWSMLFLALALWRGRTSTRRSRDDEGF